jgi:uncharacterized phosphosugar-binding protein
MRSFYQNYIDALLTGTAEVRNGLSVISQAGEMAAQRLAAGGQLFIAGVRPDFVSEGMVRAGGLMLLKEYRPGAEVSENDTVIVGGSLTSPEQDLALLKQLRETGASLIGVGPSLNKGFQQSVELWALDSSLPLPSAVVQRFGGASYPLVSLQNLVILWTLTGELVGALTRKGLMPTMYQSVAVPGARQRNAQFSPHRFHPHHSVEPIDEGELGCGYLDALDGCFHRLRDEETEAIERVAEVCVKVKAAGHHNYASLISHFPVYQAGAPGDPKLICPLTPMSGETPSDTELAAKLQPGDLYFFLGYYRRPKAAYQVAKRIGCQIVEVIAGTDAPLTEAPFPDYTIDPKWPYGDALVSLPNYDVKILPASGIVQSAIYWSVVGSMVSKMP